MTFVTEHLPRFMEVFTVNKEKIRASKGCTHLELVRDVKQPNVLFTLSHWDSEDHLHAYRSSELFKNTWSLTKPLFAMEAEAWSLESISGII